MFNFEEWQEEIWNHRFQEGDHNIVGMAIDWNGFRLEYGEQVLQAAEIEYTDENIDEKLDEYGVPSGIQEEVMGDFPTGWGFND